MIYPVCQSCGEIIYDKADRSHLIAKTEANYKAYGKRIIDHPMNIAITHHGACNDAQNIGNNPMKVKALIKKICEYEGWKNEFS